MNADVNTAPKPGMSTQKKWLIGCGGCLGVLVLLAIVLGVLGWFFGNSLKDMSNKSVQDIFGPNYQPEGYMAIGMPVGQANVKNMVMLLDTRQGKMLIGLDMGVKPGDMQIIKSGNAAQIQKYLEQTSAQINESSAAGGNAKVQDIRFDTIESVALKPGGIKFPVANTTVQAERKGQISYSPAVAALIPEAGNKLVVLVAADPKNSSSDSQADFSEEQKTLKTEVLQVIQDSDLDDRLQ